MHAILSLGNTTYDVQVGVVGLLLAVWAVGSAWEALRARRARLGVSGTVAALRSGDPLRV